MANLVSRITSAGTYFTGQPTKIPDGVVTNGLILYLNANNPASYPGTGNTWYDLSGQGAHGTINNLSSGNITFVSAGTQSYFNFATASDLNYIGSTASQDYQDITILFQPDYTYTSGLIGLISTGNAASSLDHSLRFNAGQIPWNLADTGNNNDWANGSVPASGTGVVNYYDNNTLYTSTFNIPAGWNVLGGAKNSGTWTGNWSYFLGSGGYTGNRGFQGKIAAVLMYNRTLTAAEQRQNTDALLNRFNFVSKSAQFDEVSYNPTSGGTIAYSATPDKRTNLELYSQDFSQASYWGLANITLLNNATVAPDGTLTATKFQETAVTNFFGVSSNPVGQYNTTYTMSAYFKADERNVVGFNFSALSGGIIEWNLSTQTAFSVGTLYSKNSIVSVGNGWYRCSATFTTPSSGANILYHTIPFNGNTGDIYAGTPGYGVYIWGAQLETGISATPYITTDGIGSISRANTQLYRYTTNWNRSFWNTNQTNSNNTVLLTSATTAPDGSLTAYKFVANTGVDPNLGNSGLLVQQNGYGQITQGLVYTQSLFFKPAEFNTLRIRNNADGSIYDFVAGTTPVATSGVLRPQLQNVGNEWYRASWSFVAQSIGGGGGRSDNWSYRLANTGDGTSGIYIWGPQLQLGNTLSPFIATSASNTAINIFNTRTDNLGDVLTINDFDEVTYYNPQNKNLLDATTYFGDASTSYTNYWRFADGTLIAYATGTLDPIGSYSSTLCTQDTATSEHYIECYNIPRLKDTTIPYTWSVYLKNNGNPAVAVGLFESVTSNYSFITINLLTGVLSNQFGGGTANYVGSSVSDVGNGWYRVSISVIPAKSNSGSLYSVRLAMLTAVGGVNNFTGDGVSGFYMWGPQLEIGRQVTPYVSTTNKNLFAGTESLTNYKPIDTYNGYPWVTSTVNVVSTTDLDPNGNYTATKVSYNSLYSQIQTPSTGVPVASNTIYTISVSVKSTQQLFSIVTGNNAPYPSGSTQWAYYDLVNNYAQWPGGSPLPTSITITPENNGYKRCTLSVQTDSTQNQMYVSFWMGGYGGAQPANTMTLFGPQIEVGNTATPYQANTISLSSKTLNGGTIAVANEIDEVTWNPPIVTANLKLNLDAANPNNYNGGNTWYDTSGNGYNGTLSSNVKSSSSNYGVVTFDGTSYPSPQTQVALSTTGSSLGMINSDFTVEAWVNGANTGVVGGSAFPNYTIFSLFGSSATSGSNYALSAQSGYLSCGFYDTGAGYNARILPNTWYQIVQTYNYTTKTIKIYTNGNLSDSATSGTDLNANAAVAQAVVGNGTWGGGGWIGSIPVVRVYNKELSQSEIKQNYDALAYRYNL